MGRKKRVVVGVDVGLSGGDETVIATLERSEDGSTIVFVQDAKRLVTIGPEWVGWTKGDHELSGDMQNVFVRLVPPETASDENVDEARAHFERCGAKVMVLPRRRAAVVLTPREKRPHRRAREVIDAMVGEANFEEKAALASFVGELMDQVGL